MAKGEQRRFGDVVVTLTGPDWTPVVTRAPALTRISLASVGKGLVTVDERGLVVAGQVCYVPVDVGVNLSVLCRKTHDGRPPKVRAADEDEGA